MAEYHGECEVCGEPYTSAEDEHDHSAEVVVIRDGFRGQYLAPTEVLDIEDLLGEGSVPAEVKAAAERWIAEMGIPAEHTIQDGDEDTVLDWLILQGESALYAAGFSILSEDGYVIYRLQGQDA